MYTEILYFLRNKRIKGYPKGQMFLYTTDAIESFWDAIESPKHFSSSFCNSLHTKQLLVFWEFFSDFILIELNLQ